MSEIVPWLHYGWRCELVVKAGDIRLYLYEGCRLIFDEPGPCRMGRVGTSRGVENRHYARSQR